MANPLDQKIEEDITMMDGEIVFLRIVQIIEQLKKRGEAEPRVQSPGQATLTALLSELQARKQEILQ